MTFLIFILYQMHCMHTESWSDQIMISWACNWYKCLCCVKSISNLFRFVALFFVQLEILYDYFANDQAFLPHFRAICSEIRRRALVSALKIVRILKLCQFGCLDSPQYNFMYVHREPLISCCACLTRLLFHSTNTHAYRVWLNLNVWNEWTNERTNVTNVYMHIALPFILNVKIGHLFS